MDVHLLDIDPDLGAELRAADRGRAREELVCQQFALAPGAWAASEDFCDGKNLGLLVAGGLLVREVSLGTGTGAEVLGTGDILCPWFLDDATSSLPLDSRFEILEPTQVVVLDARFTAALAHWPALVPVLVQRVLRRSRWLAALLAIANVGRLETRVAALLWHLADRWGSVRAEGVIVPLRLTHDLIARLVGARRPSVTTAIGSLTAAGAIERLPDGTWLLRSSAPLMSAA